MINKIIKLLNENKNVNDYLINEIDLESKQLYFVLNKLETTRVVNVNDYKIIIYNRHDNKIGSAKFNIYTNDTDDEIRLKINNAVNNAKNISNPSFDLLVSDKKNSIIESNFINMDLIDVAKSIANNIINIKKDINTTINALEIFVNKKTYRVINNLGLDKKEIRYDAFIEAIPTYTKDYSVEIYKSFEIKDLDDLYIKSTINESLDMVKYRYLAKKIDKIDNIKVAFRENEIEEIFNEIISDLSFSSLYNKSNKYNINDKIFNDDFNLTLCSKLPHSSYSKSFDMYGYELNDVKLIEKGIVKSNHGDIVNAQYLNTTPTGIIDCFKIDLGKNEISGDYLECITLSSIQIDLFNDYIGGEVRLAYLHKDNKIIPVTNVYISAKISEAFKTIELDKNITNTKCYSGPKLIAMNNFKLL